MLMFSDQDVVSFFNGCIDIQKFEALPHEVKGRVKDLMRHARLKWVCFSPAVGFGLKVFEEPSCNFNGDEVQEVLGASGPAWRVDLYGSWLRCPPKDYVPPPKPVSLVVASKNGRRFWSEVAENEEGQVIGGWKSSRGLGTVYTTQEAAEEVANRVGGIVLEKE